MRRFRLLILVIIAGCASYVKQWTPTMQASLGHNIQARTKCTSGPLMKNSLLVESDLTLELQESQPPPTLVPTGVHSL